VRRDAGQERGDHRARRDEIEAYPAPTLQAVPVSGGGAFQANRARRAVEAITGDVP
jgi:hypothetical protein